ncbi:MAG TPA: TonB-dependent receptor [Candidatus Krumholzibacteria bacterium]|nr:TonB-dependent receptor [Candidatus Krumholzibacteria bacterium]HPD70571.1 TonB-dependent receptor [Candidatus Krumholzibacteria bacterium]HRY39729.1 TonB-dependent receptor [Candidatus Krumholzibacteria bacterium]
MRGVGRVVTGGALAILAGMAIAPPAAWAGTTGTLSGRVVDADGAPVVAATIVVVGTRLGAYTDADGKFAILNVPAGTYEVKASRLGFNPVSMTGVIVSADQTARLDIRLGGTTLQAEEVVIVAERPPVELGLTSSQANLTTEQIEELPVQTLDDIVNLQAGVVDNHFRGGREGEVQYQVDGVSVNNAFDNSSTLTLDRSLLQEVQVISGTFDAEYGQAMSGVVNAVLKEGGETFEVTGEAYAGGFYFPGREEERRTSDEFRPLGTTSIQATLSGPLVGRDTTFLLSLRRYDWEDFIYGTKTFRTSDRANFETNVYDGTGDGSEVPLGYSGEWSGAAQVTNRSLGNDKLSYQVIFNQQNGRRASWDYRLNPDGLSLQRSYGIVHGVDWTHTFGAATFLETSVRQNYFDYRDRIWDAYSPAYDAAGSPEGSDNFNNGAIVQGAQFNQYVQRTNSVVVKGALTSQVDPENRIKAGFEFTAPKVQFGSPVTLRFATEQGVEQIVRHENEPPDFPGVQTNYPVSGAAFFQDQLEQEHLTVRAGLRLDYFDARATVPSDLANPANAIPGAPESVPRETSVKSAVSPRLGVAYPIEDKAAIHFAYGHFYQSPSIGTIFENSNYDILRNLQAGTVDYGVLGNPDIKPERTIQYEIGYKQILTPDLGFDLTIFYKDIRDLIGVEFIDTYTGAQYARLTNVDFGNVFGITFAIDHRRLGPVSLAMDYTLLQALGNASDPHETATRAANGEDPRPRLLPFNWDQRHTVNLTAALTQPGDYTVSTVLRIGSGQPYTPQIESGFGFGLEANSGRKPTAFLVDLRAEKTLAFAVSPDLSAGVFLRVFNLFDARYNNGSVFASTGSPYYSRFPSTDRNSLEDPLWFYPPRRVELGLRMGWR